MEITDENKSRFQNVSTLWLLFCFGLVVLFFINANGGLANSTRAQAPDGQLLYLLSKSVGLTALLLLWWQLFSSLILSSRLFSKAKLSILKPGKVTHIVFGSLLAVLILSHAGMFISAASLRQESLAINLLIPEFTGHYQTALSLGVIALFLILAAVIMAGARKYMPRLWLHGHKLVVLAFGLASLHAVLIGSETGSGFLMYLIILFVFSIAIIIALKTWHSLAKS